jgi:hypothetical protein
LFGDRSIKVRAPIERAKPKIRSESDSMRDFGIVPSFGSAINWASSLLEQFVESAI